MADTFAYIANGKPCRDIISTRLQTNDAYLSLGENFDNYEFKRSAELDASKLLYDRLAGLRKKYSYLRLWYSGGLDSTLVLDTAIKSGIHIDEILIMKRWNPEFSSLYPELSPEREVQAIALDKIPEIELQLPNTKITVVDVMKDEYYSAVFEHPDWYCDTSSFWYDIPGSVPTIFYKHINSKYQLINEPENRCDIIGGVTPDIYWNPNIEKWQFTFVDNPFHHCFGPTTENFLVTDDMPELVEGHVNSIINNFLEETKPAKFSAQFGDSYIRDLKKHSDVYKNLHVDHSKEHVKSVRLDQLQVPTQDYFWKKQTTKSFFNLINRYNPMCKSVELYINNTDWKSIEQVHNNGLTCTKEWILN